MRSVSTDLEMLKDIWRLSFLRDSAASVLERSAK
jgi:hypothetical protein